MKRLAAVVALLLAASRAQAAPREVTLPAYQRVVLANGLAVSVMPRPSLPLVEIRFMMRGGSVDDPVGREGVANLVARLLPRATTGRTASQLADALAEAGGSLDADVGGEDLTVSASVLADSASVALAAVAEVVRHPAFTPRDFAAAVREVRGDIAAARDDPSDLADRALGPAVFGTSRYAHPVSGSEVSLARIRRADIVRWYARHARPDSAALVIVGDVDTARVWRQVREAFADWAAPPGVAAAAVSPARPAPRRTRHITVVPREDITQAQVRFAEIACGHDTPDLAALQVANTLLSDGYTSRLVRELRVAHGLTYGVTSRFASYRHTGYFAISTSTANAHLREIVVRTLQQTDSLVRMGPSEDEVERAKAFVLGQYPAGFQAPEDLAEQLVDQEFYPLPADDVTQYARRVRAVTAADVRRALQRWVHPARWEIVVVAPEGVARWALRGLAPLSVVASP